MLHYAGLHCRFQNGEVVAGESCGQTVVHAICCTRRLTLCALGVVVEGDREFTRARRFAAILLANAVWLTKADIGSHLPPASPSPQ